MDFGTWLSTPEVFGLPGSAVAAFSAGAVVLIAAVGTKFLQDRDKRRPILESRAEARRAAEEQRRVLNQQNTSTLRRKNTGAPGNGGQFAAHGHTDSDVQL